MEFCSVLRSRCSMDQPATCRCPYKAEASSGFASYGMDGELDRSELAGIGLVLVSEGALCDGSKLGAAAGG